MSENMIPKAPLFRDPIFDGAADPTIIWNKDEKAWWILYTNRRASVPSPGVSWVHGTDIGVASSTDGVNWLYRGTLKGLEFEEGHNTFWAPEILFHEGIYHMYVSYVKGIPTSWTGSRDIIHYTSKDLWNWSFESILKLSSNRVIDAGIHKLPNGLWRMWYKDEVNHSYTYAADSKDLYTWEVVGPIITDCNHEGPNVFYFNNKYWMITDHWKGLGVYSSEDAINWTRQKDILDNEGKRTDDGSYGHHADIFVTGENAYIFYFTHPEININEKITGEWAYKHKRTSIQVAKLEVINGELICDRDKNFDLTLLPENY